MATRTRWGIAGAVLLLHGMALAQQPAMSDSAMRRVGAALADMQTRPFIEAHPDLRFRYLGMQAYHEGRKREAMEHFLLAARYADKTSQALISLMYWTGDGVALDRPRGYAWMDLAASRGYVELKRQRDMYWNALNEPEREQAATLRRSLDADYGDAGGTRRMTLELGSVRSAVTGSHLGWAGNGVVMFADPASRAASGENVANLVGRSGAMGTDLGQLYDTVRLDTTQYQELKDLQWQVQMQGRVDVGPLQPVAKPVDKPHPLD